MGRCHFRPWLPIVRVPKVVNELGADKVDTEEQARRAAQHLKELQSLFFAPSEAMAGFTILFPHVGRGQ